MPRSASRAAPSWGTSGRGDLCTGSACSSSEEEDCGTGDIIEPVDELSGFVLVAPENADTLRAPVLAVGIVLAELVPVIERALVAPPPLLLLLTLVLTLAIVNARALVPPPAKVLAGVAMLPLEVNTCASGGAGLESAADRTGLPRAALADVVRSVGLLCWRSIAGDPMVARPDGGVCSCCCCCCGAVAGAIG